MNHLSIIPLSLTIMLGPQILVAMLLIARKDAVRSSLTYIAAISISTIATTLLYKFLGSVTHFHKISISGKPVIKYFLVAVLVFIIIRTIIDRNKITKKPNWITHVNTCSRWNIFFIGILLIALMPADIAIEFTVANLLNYDKQPITAGLPFFAAVTTIASLPLLLYLITGKKGHDKIKQINDWLNTHGYVINVVVLSIFIYILLK